MANTKKLTVLHSNDLHGDFLAEEVDTQLIGRASMLSGYVSKVRKDEQPRRVATSCRGVLDEYLSCHQNLDHQICERLEITEQDE